MQLMYWKAVQNNILLTEQANEFSEIDKDAISTFILEGLKTKFLHNTKSGQFTLNENNICFLLDDCLIGKSGDVINFKEKLDIYGKGGSIIGYYTGWKEKNDNFSYIEVLFWVDVRQKKIKIRLRLTPRMKLECKLNMVINGLFNERILQFDELGKRKQFVFEI